MLLILAIVSLLSGCDNNSFLEKVGLKEKELTGEVFIVTNSGQSIKLGLVKVIAYSEQKILNCIKEKTLDWTTEKQRLFDEYTSAQEKLKTYQDDIKFYNIKSRSEEGDAWAKDRWSEALSQAEYDNASNDLNIIKKQYELYKSGSYILDCIKSDMTEKLTTTTNADGQFSMKVPNEKIALFASSSRNVVGETENYYWLIWVDSDKRHVIFSNNNFYETLCPACIVVKLETKDKTESILAKLISVTSIYENKRLYQKLVTYNPDVKEYQEKLLFYTDKIKEKDAYFKEYFKNGKQKEMN